MSISKMVLKPKTFYILLAVVTIGSVFVLSQVPKAFAGYGNPPDYTGYFTHQSLPSSGYLNVIDTGLTPTTSISAFEAQVLSIHNGPDTKNGEGWAIGADFIIQTMRGGTDLYRPTAADIADWEQKLTNSDLQLSVANYCTLEANSGYQDGDIAWVKQAQCGSSLIFSSISTGTVYYIVRVDCGNPLGTWPGLPAYNPSWSISGRTGVSTTSFADSDSNYATAHPPSNPLIVQLGSELYWTNVGHNSGPGTATINYGVRFTINNKPITPPTGINSTVPGACLWGAATEAAPPALWNGSPCSTTGGNTSATLASNANTGPYDHNNFLVSSAWAKPGDEFCEWIAYFPRASTSNTDGGDIPQCIQVSQPWKLSATTTTNPLVTTAAPGSTVTFSSIISNDTEGGTATNFCYGPRYFYSSTATPTKLPNGTYANEIGGNTSNGCNGVLTPGQVWGPNGNTIQTTVALPNNPADAYVCGTFAFSPYDSEGDANGRSVTPDCIAIVSPNSTACVYPISVFPTNPGPSKQFTVTAYINGGTAANTAAMMFADNFYINVIGPVPGNGGPTFTSTNSGLLKRLGAGNVFSATTTLIGPTNNVGNYPVDWGVTGPISPIDCGSKTSNGLPSGSCVGDCSINSEVPVSNHPYFTVMGGDVAAGAGFGACAEDSTAGITGWNDDGGSYKGAGVQMAALALSDIKHFPSLLGIIGGGAEPYGLSFANSGSGVTSDTTGDYGGQFGYLPCLPDYVDSINTSTATPWTDDSDFGTSDTYTATGPLTLAGSAPIQLSPNTVINLQVNGDVYINNNITYDDSGGAGNYPRLNLYATGSIYIAPGVTQLHGLYVAQGTAAASELPSSSASVPPGTFVTCASEDVTQSIFTELTDFNDCSTNQLTVYGSVAAQSLHLDRDSGDIDNGGPAESFHFSPELWEGTPLCSAITSDPLCTGATSSDWDAVSSLPPTL